MTAIAEEVSPHCMQRAFRQVLDAFSHPGTVRRIEPEPARAESPETFGASLETLVRLFVDQAVSFCVRDREPHEEERYLVSETHAPCVPCRKAGFIVVPAHAGTTIMREAVLEASRGTFLAPEGGATMLMGCEHIAVAGAEVSRTLSTVEVRGPGVADVNRFEIDQTAWAEARAERDDEYPCGIEIVLVDAVGNLVAVPRSSGLVVVDGMVR